jgi:23S rRNA (uridine2552-2'-O)-methyltransferase
MGKRSRPDHFTDRAKKAGYQARSVYKLEELDKRFALLRPGQRVLDVGAAPGSWTQFAARRVGKSGRVVSVDLKELPALEELEQVTVVVGDIYDEAVIGQLRATGPYDLVMSDAAPNTTGNRTLDTARSAALVEHVLWLSESLLVPGGACVAKIFQGGEEQSLLQEVRSRFKEGKLIKPKASRSESFETFLIGVGRQ